MNNPSPYDFMLNFNAVASDEVGQNGEVCKNQASTSLISFRVTASEKAQLKQMAGVLGVSGYIRQRLFGDKTEKRPKRYLTKTRKPKLSHVEVARILGMLGQSELATGILALSLAMEAHDRTIAAEETALMRQACDTVQDIKDMLIIALGVKPQQESVE